MGFKNTRNISLVLRYVHLVRNFGPTDIASLSVSLPIKRPLTCGARRLNGEFLECGDRMPKLAAFFGRSF